MPPGSVITYIGGALRRRVRDLGRLGHRATCVPGISRLFDALHGSRWTRARCLFIVSTGRVGTVTLCRLLDADEGTSAYHEPWPSMLEQQWKAFREGGTRPMRYARQIGRARRKLIGRAMRQGKVYAESTLMQYFAPVIAELLPESRFLYVHRHPGGIVRSGMRRGWYVHHIRDAYRLRPAPGDSAYEQFQEWDQFDRVCWLWNLINDHLLRFRDTMPEDRVMSVSYEDLFQKQLPERLDLVGRIFRFIDRPVPDAATLKELLEIRHNAQTEGEFPRYEEWNPDLKKRLFDIAGETMGKLGYS
jgi:hypothetical protein